LLAGFAHEIHLYDAFFKWLSSFACLCARAEAVEDKFVDPYSKEAWKGALQVISTF